MRACDDLRDLLDRPLGRPPRSRAFPPNRWSAGEVERRIAGEAVEWGYVFDASGRQVVRRRGTARAIAFSARELALLKDAVVVHNHPLVAGDDAEGQTFSRLDLASAVRYDVAEPRVVAGDWRFVLRRPEGGWPADEGVLLGVYNDEEAVADRALAIAVARGALAPARRRSLLADATLRRMAAAGWVVYLRQRTEPSP